MPFRTFTALLVLSNGKVVKAESSDSEKLYPKTFLQFFQQIVEGLITNECQSGELRITSKADKLLVVTSGDLKNCRPAIIKKVQEIFFLETGDQ